MFKVADFKKIRQDGKTIPEDMGASEMISLGWEPCKVIEAIWKWGEQTCQLNCPHGLLALVVANRQYVVSLEDDEKGNSRLFINSGDGVRRREISGSVDINGRIRVGKYLWFEKEFAMPDSAFCVVFEALDDSAMHYLFIDANTGDLLKAQYFR